MALINSAVLSAVQSPATRVDGVRRLGLARRFGGSVGAYSLRDIGDGGYVVEVRRDSDDALKSFTAGEVTNGVLASWVGGSNNGYVRTWYDQSGNDVIKNLTQTETSKQPAIVASGAVLVDSSGLPAMSFASSGTRYLDLAVGVTISSQAQFYVLGVTDVSQSRAIAGRKSTNTDFFRFTSTDVESYKANSQGTTFGTISELPDRLVVSVDRNASNQTKMFEDNVQSGVTRTNITGNS